MDQQPTTLDTYLQREHQHAAGTIVNAMDGVTFGHALTAMRHLHYEGWRRRHQITGNNREATDQLPAGSLIRTNLGELRESYYREDTAYKLWWRYPDGENAGCPSRSLAYPITILDTP